MTVEGRLRHSWRHGKLKHPATLDDYANMSESAVALFEATGNKDYLDQAQDWVKVLDRHYWDRDKGGYFLTADDTEALIVRSKNAHDNAVPGGNGTLLGVLVRLHFLTGDTAYRTRAEDLVAAFAGEVSRNFFPLATLLNNNELLRGATQVVIVGTRGDTATDALLQTVFTTNAPNRILQVIGPDDALPENHPAQGKGQVADAATAYVCHGPVCSLPISTEEDLRRSLDPRAG